MIVEAKIQERLGELITTAKGGIQEFLVETKQGSKEVVRLFCNSDKMQTLLALKPGDVVRASTPENFFFLKA